MGDGGWGERPEGREEVEEEVKEEERQQRVKVTWWSKQERKIRKRKNRK